MREFFKPEDFGPMIDNGTSWIYVAEICNKKLNQLVESWPTVYSFMNHPYANGWDDMSKFPNKNPSHQARLALIEEYTKCEKHEPEHVFIGPETGNWSTKCKHCGVELQAKWSEKK